MLARVAARRSLARCNSSLAPAARRIALPQQPSRPLSVAAAHAQAGRRDPVAAALAKHWPSPPPPPPQWPANRPPAPEPTAAQIEAGVGTRPPPLIPPLRPEDRPAGDTARYYVKVDELGRAYATGRRKTAVASVVLWPTPADRAASVRVNGMDLADFLGGHWALRHVVLSPFLKTATTGEFTVTARVDGGGLSGQAQAIRHGISTALQGIDLAFRKPLRAAGFVTRDPRRRERKKPGQAGARKKFAWVKR